MLTHQKRKDYRCSHPGCQKIYCGYRSLKRHCATQHGTYLHPPSSQPSALNTQPCPPLWEPPRLPEVKDGASTSADCSRSYFPPPQPLSVFQFEGSTNCRTSYSNYTLAANLNLSHRPEDPNRSQVKFPVISQSWSLAANAASESAVDLPASYNMVMPNQWSSASSLGGSVVDPVGPEAVQTWESMACLRGNRPILLKLGMRQQKPQNKQQIPLVSGEASCSTSKVIGSSADHMEPIIPPLLPAPKSKAKKKSVKKKILEAATIPTPPLPSPKPNTQRRPRPRPAYLVSPSQVAMASFSKESTPSDTLKVLQLHTLCCRSFSTWVMFR